MPSDMGDKQPPSGGKPSGMGGDMKKFYIEGEQVYENDSFTIKLVR
jgi:hypothetical protein